jgi:hypothetical protein
MRRLLVSLGVVVAFGVPVTAQAATTVGQSTFEATFPICNGDLVRVSGPLATVTSVTTTSSGGVIMAVHFQPQGVTGINLSTGATFRATGVTRDLLVISPSGGITETFVNRFQLQATGGAESYIVSEVFHVTVSADGTVRVVFDKVSTSC